MQAAAAIVAAAVIPALLLAAPAPGAEGSGAGAVCRIEPRILDVAVAPGPLVVRIELRPRAGRAPSPPAQIDPGVHIASVAGIPLPPPGTGGEGIEEDAVLRTVEDRLDVAGGAPIPNGVRELVVRFARPSDGDPNTRGDGDAGDLLAMLMDLPDGSVAPICLGGAVDGVPFECCDSVTVRNRGLRDLPHGIFPEAAAGPR